MSKSFLRLNLKAGAAVAAFALMGVIALPADAHGQKPHAKTPRVSQTFKTQSQVVAKRTVRVIESGTSGADMTQGPDTRLPPVDAKVMTSSESANVVTCPQGKEDAAWKQVPLELRSQARPGECYARLLTTPKVETYMDHVVVTPEKVATRTIAPVTRMVEKDVMVTPERVVTKVIPEVTSQHLVTEVVREATWREEVIPARYETHTEQVLVEPAHQEWVKTAGVPQDAPMVTPDQHLPVRYNDSGYLSWPGKDHQRVEASQEAQAYLQDGNPPAIWCLKTVPGVYRDREVKVMVEPASTRRIEVPAVTRKVMRTVVERPEHTEEFTVAAVYEKRKVKEVIEAERTEDYTIPAVYKDVEKTRVSGPAESVWRRVLCNKNASPEVIMQVQKALNAKGYNVGRPDGQLGRQTVAAMQKFQADNGLPQGQVTVEGVKLLGINVD